MKITFLGTGTSSGVPELLCTCKACKSIDPRDKRLRTSALIEVDGKNILIDCGPDFRQQMIEHKVSHIDAVLLTHHHYDHIGGLDDLRPLTKQKPLPIYAEGYVLDNIKQTMPYAFQEKYTAYIPQFALNIIDNRKFNIFGIDILPVRLMHNSLPILGFRIGSMAYLTDVKTIPEEEFGKLLGLDLLVIDGLRLNPHVSHLSISEAADLSKRIGAQSSYLVHLSHQAGCFTEIEESLPANVYCAYDGLCLCL